MKRMLAVTLSVGGVALFAVLLLLCIPPSRLFPARKTPPSESLPPTDCPYLLTIDDGFVAIRQIGEKAPYRVFDLPEVMLSDYDRALLHKGLLCSSPEEAERLAEDFVG